MREFYVNNKDFKEYVDKYARDNKISVGEALTHAIIREIYHFYKGRV